MAKAQRSSRQDAREHTQNRVLNAADELFRRDGYHSADLRQIARRAGVTTGAVYWSFQSKADLFLAVYDRYLDQRLQEVRALIEEPDPARRNEQAIQEWFRRLEEHREWHRVLLEFRLHAAREPELNAKFLQRHHRFLDAAAQGFVKPGQATSPGVRQVTTAFIALANGYALERLNDPERVTPDQHARAAEWLLQSVIPAFRQKGDL